MDAQWVAILVTLAMFIVGLAFWSGYLTAHVRRNQADIALLASTISRFIESLCYKKN